MEATVIIPLYQVLVLVLGFVSTSAVIAYMTKRNTEDIKAMRIQNTKEINNIKKDYVSSELYTNEVRHINDSLADIKGQNTQILAMLASKSN